MKQTEGKNIMTLGSIEEDPLRYELCRQCRHHARFLYDIGIPFGATMKEYLRNYLLGLLQGIELSTKPNIYPITMKIRAIKGIRDRIKWNR